jgi:outer membrane protein assembly factor BamB
MQKKWIVLTIVMLFAVIAGTCSASRIPAELEGLRGVCGVVSTSGRADLPLEIAKQGGLVVHCITIDGSEKILGAAEKAGLGGIVSAEQLSIKTLPYRDDLLNALVVEDYAAAVKQGLSDAEALRVVSPGGYFCRKIKGRWEVTIKERPAGMDEWTHNYRDAGGNCGVSKDSIIKLPLGVRWNDDLPFNLSSRMESSNAWTNTRGLAVADGRVYYVTNCASENLKNTCLEMTNSKVTPNQYLTVRDAWNGAFLWRYNLGDIFYGGLHYTARAPLAAIGGKVYAVSKEKGLLEFDGKSGKVLRQFQTVFFGSILAVSDNVLVAVSWKDGDNVGGLTGVDRRRLDNKVSEGSIVAYDLGSGRKLWEKKRIAASIRVADGRVYIVERQGRDEFALDVYNRQTRRGIYKDYVHNDLKKMEDKFGTPPGRGDQSVVALDLKSGKQLWAVNNDILKLAPVDHIAIDVAGLDSVVVSKNGYALTNGYGSTGAESIVLSGPKGNVLFRQDAHGFAVMHDGAVHVAGRTIDPVTGKNLGKPAINVGGTICTPSIYVNGIMTRNRSNQYQSEGKNVTFGAARGSCMFAAVPANGAFYTPQTWCSCAPGVVPGFVSFGPIHREPTSDEMVAGVSLVKGPAYGKQASGKADGWATYLGTGNRSSANLSATLPENLNIKWQRKIAKPIGDSAIELSWKESLDSLVTAPIASSGLVIAADRHRHKVVAVRAADGEPAWERIVAGRVSTPPTICQGLCLFGAADGYVYALDAKDGSLAWKMRMGPEERRMISHGQAESPWSVFSSVLVSDGIAYASAGRTTAAEGGIVIRAFVPATGEIVWSKVVSYLTGNRRDHTNDVMYIHGGNLHLFKTTLDLKSGKVTENPIEVYNKARQDWHRERHLFQQATKKGETPEPLGPEPKRAMNMPLENSGIEGLASSNWTKLGDRRRRNSNLDGVMGLLFAWDDSIICSSNMYGGISAYDRAVPVDKNARPKRMWGFGRQTEQVTGLALGKNAVVVGGGVYPEVGNVSGFIRVLDRVSGKEIASIDFPAVLSYNGVAISNGEIYVTLEDGSLICLAGENK